jgi:transposase
MNRYVQGENRNQLSLEPLCLDDMINEDNPVRAIEVIVEKMGINNLGFEYSETKHTGRKPYSPEDMFKLYAYSYYNGIRSSRKIERECHRNIEVMWLTGALKPDHKTIANFRKDNKKAIKAAFRQFSLICAELGLISREVVAVDGSKFRACNGRMRYHSKGKIAEKMRYYSEAAEKYINLLEQCDREDNENPPTSMNRKELTEKLDKIQKRIAALNKISDRVSEEGTIYLTDSDARLMRSHNGGGDISHNVQVAVEAKNHIVVAVDVTSNAVDYAQLHNISLQAKEGMDSENLIAIADRGYYSGEEFVKCKADGIQPIAPKPDRGNGQCEGYTKQHFHFDAETDVYICPQGHQLAQPQQRRTERKGKRYYNIEACKSCNSKELCVPKNKYRYIQRLEFDDYSDQVDAFTKANYTLYTQRKCMVEHPFGTVKRALGFTYFLTRGKENVRTESRLHFLAYNMKRLINIVGTTGLQAALQG